MCSCVMKGELLGSRVSLKEFQRVSQIRGGTGNTRKIVVAIDGITSLHIVIAQQVAPPPPPKDREQS
jgi:hypothetical protein